MSMKSLIRLNREVSVPGKPKGWVVRELLNPTTNKSVVNYEFYTSEQIYVVDDIDNFTCNKSFQEFVISSLLHRILQDHLK